MKERKEIVDDFFFFQDCTNRDGFVISKRFEKSSMRLDEIFNDLSQKVFSFHLLSTRNDHLLSLPKEILRKRGIFLYSMFCDRWIDVNPVITVNI